MKGRLSLAPQGSGLEHVCSQAEHSFGGRLLPVRRRRLRPLLLLLPLLCRRLRVSPL